MERLKKACFEKRKKPHSIPQIKSHVIELPNEDLSGQYQAIIS
jgi:hypothetical protein